MPRPREFDMDDALDAAIGTFWTQGYEATSMTDLVAATGLHKGSIYKAFDDKHDLFMKSLTRYLDMAHRQTSRTFAEAPTPMDGLRAWLQGVVCLCSDQPVKRGCLAMNAAVELGPHDPQVRTLLENHHARTSRMLTETIEAGQQSGQIRKDLTADQLAKSLFVFGAGLLGTSKVLCEAIDAGEMVESALAMVCTGRQVS
ncbi:MAG TPA: TetR/AcrR family transcriptional regulator [Candidatus Latescibacteria bacterium]|nr:TetR/AcrR family transcriptional regulator [Candidatus Latescibacterota bacterium]HJP33116.1 TetR/AcrR family transcriptional regulator [Candidatus Latescibacterota bacterium]